MFYLLYYIIKKVQDHTKYLNLKKNKIKYPSCIKMFQCESI